MGGQLRERMTNCCLPLISFVVKSSLIRDCLAEIALHETQLEQDSQAGLAEEHISTSSHLPWEVLGTASPPLKIAPPSARPSASHPARSKGSLVGASGKQWEDRERHVIGPRISFGGLFFPSTLKFLLTHTVLMLLMRRKKKDKTLGREGVGTAVSECKEET